jgi:hypothetical protein
MTLTRNARVNDITVRIKDLLRRGLYELFAERGGCRDCREKPHAEIAEGQRVNS